MSLLPIPSVLGMSAGYVSETEAKRQSETKGVYETRMVMPALQKPPYIRRRGAAKVAAQMQKMIVGTARPSEMPNFSSNGNNSLSEQDLKDIGNAEHTLLKDPSLGVSHGIKYRRRGAAFSRRRTFALQTPEATQRVSDQDLVAWQRAEGPMGAVVKRVQSERQSVMKKSETSSETEVKGKTESDAKEVQAMQRSGIGKPVLDFFATIAISKASDEGVIGAAIVKASAPANYKPEYYNMVLVIDISGSTGSSTRFGNSSRQILQIEREAAIACINQANPKWNIGIVLFDNRQINAYDIQPMTDKNKKAAIAILNDENIVTPSGTTDIKGGLALAAEMLDRKYKEDLKAKVFAANEAVGMTDGFDTSGTPVDKIAYAEARTDMCETFNHNILPFSINIQGVGSGPKYEELRAAADTFDGEFGMPEDPAQLENILTTICKPKVKGVVLTESQLTFTVYSEPGKTCDFDIYCQDKDYDPLHQDHGVKDNHQVDTYTVSFPAALNNRENSVLFKATGQGKCYVRAEWNGGTDLLGSVPVKFSVAEPTIIDFDNLPQQVDPRVALRAELIEFQQGLDAIMAMKLMTKRRELIRYYIKRSSIDNLPLKSALASIDSKMDEVFAKVKNASGYQKQEYALKAENFMLNFIRKRYFRFYDPSWRGPSTLAAVRAMKELDALGIFHAVTRSEAELMLVNDLSMEVLVRPSVQGDDFLSLTFRNKLARREGGGQYPIQHELYKMNERNELVVASEAPTFRDQPNLISMLKTYFPNALRNTAFKKD